jgi:hypothetical protein
MKILEKFDNFFELVDKWLVIMVIMASVLSLLMPASLIISGLLISYFYINLTDETSKKYQQQIILTALIVSLSTLTIGV